MHLTAASSLLIKCRAIGVGIRSVIEHIVKKDVGSAGLVKSSFCGSSDPGVPALVSLIQLRDQRRAVLAGREANLRMPGSGPL
jgi:hypothetical protein